MRLRALFLGFFFIAAFLWVTGSAKWDVRRMASPLLHTALKWSEPTAVRGNGSTPEEQNNIDIYKAARQATGRYFQLPLSASNSPTEGRPLSGSWPDRRRA